MNRDDVLKAADEENVRFMRLQFTDIMGIIKNVEIPRNGERCQALLQPACTRPYTEAAPRRLHCITGPTARASSAQGIALGSEGT